MNKKLLSILLSIILLLTLCLCVGCKKGTTDDDKVAFELTNSDADELLYGGLNHQLIVGFDSESEIRKYTRGDKELDFYQLTTDKNYITQGNGALKMVSDGEGEKAYMPSASGISPSMQLLIAETPYGKDLSKVKAIAVDIYNAQDRAIEIKLIARTLIQEKDTAYMHLDTCYLLPQSQNRCVFDLDLDKTINFGINDVAQLSFVLPEVNKNEEPITLYFDNLCYYTFSGDATYSDQEMPSISTNGKICSFEEKYFYNKTSTWTFASWMPEDVLNAYLNVNTDYVSDGSKSLAIVVPCQGKVLRDETPYASIRLPEEYISAYDFTQFSSESSKIKIDVYIDFDEEVQVDFYFRYTVGSSTEILGTDATRLTANQWTTLEIPLYSNGVSVCDLSKICQFVFRVWQPRGGGNSIIYLDNLRVEE